MNRKLFAVIFWSSCLWMPAYAKDSPVRVTDPGTGAQALLKGKRGWVPLESGAELNKGDRIQTGPEGSVEIALGEEDALTLGENADLTFEKIEPEHTSLTLSLGSLWGTVVHTLKAEEKIEIKTPTAVAAVRGTSFAVEIQEEGDSEITEVGVFEGALEVSPVDGETPALVKADHEWQVGTGRRVGAPGPVVHMARFRPRVVALKEALAMYPLRERLKRGMPPEGLAFQQKTAPSLPGLPKFLNKPPRLQELHRDRLKRQKTRLKVWRKANKANPRPTPARAPHPPERRGPRRR